MPADETNGRSPLDEALEGLNAGYVNRQSFVGQRTGSTQLQIGLFGQFLFELGQLPIRPLP